MRAALLALSLLLLLPAAAPAKTVDLPALFQDVLPEVKETLSLAAVESCGGATACFIGTFGGQRGEDPHYTRTVRLTGGRDGLLQAAHVRRVVLAARDRVGRGGAR